MLPAFAAALEWVRSGNVSGVGRISRKVRDITNKDMWRAAVFLPFGPTRNAQRLTEGLIETWKSLSTNANQED
jgi:hypothetical protein